ncbi:hypothetical protein NDU88_003794 [Pleurodeles waltl]|uniref:Uncharacterized protein n=1 Tax=Pleurodeles waltl TaxID=8319 RepID=A0AAV7W4H4_PLEWA|nr:hypothetical protein NDU88_003794 [Pleurodeles waltl]
MGSAKAGPPGSLATSKDRVCSSSERHRDLERADQLHPLTSRGGILPRPYSTPEALRSNQRNDETLLAGGGPPRAPAAYHKLGLHRLRHSEWRRDLTSPLPRPEVVLSVRPAGAHPWFRRWGASLPRPQILRRHSSIPGRRPLSGSSGLPLIQRGASRPQPTTGHAPERKAPAILPGSASPGVSRPVPESVEASRLLPTASLHRAWGKSDGADGAHV